MKSFADDLFNSYVIIDAKANDDDDDGDDNDDENRKMQNAKLIKKTKKNWQTLSHLSDTRNSFPPQFKTSLISQCL